MPGPEDTPGSAPTSPGDREGTGHGHDFALVSPATWRSGRNEQPRAAEPHGILFLQPRGQESGGQAGAPRPQPSAERGTKSGGAGEAQGPATPAAVRPQPPSRWAPPYLVPPSADDAVHIGSLQAEGEADAEMQSQPGGKTERRAQGEPGEAVQRRRARREQGSADTIPRSATAA